jgi:hypothetical protein
LVAENARAVGRTRAVAAVVSGGTAWLLGAALVASGLGTCGLNPNVWAAAFDSSYWFFLLPALLTAGLVGLSVLAWRPIIASAPRTHWLFAAAVAAVIGMGWFVPSGFAIQVVRAGTSQVCHAGYTDALWVYFGISFAVATVLFLIWLVLIIRVAITFSAVRRDRGTSPLADDADMTSAGTTEAHLRILKDDDRQSQESSSDDGRAG